MATITKSIGTNSRDYSTPDLWEADLDDGAIYSSGDIAIGECYADSTFAYTGSLVLNGGGTVGLESYELTAAEAERHDGTAGSGVLFTRTGGNDNWFDVNRDGVTISWLECDGGYDDSASNRIQRTFDFGSSAQEAFLHHMLVHNCGDTTGYRGVYSVTTDGSSTRGLTIHNNVFYNMSGHANGATIDCTTSGSRLRRIYNNTVHGTTSANGIEATNNAYVFCQNNISVANGGDDFEFLGTSAGAYTYNMSSDTTLPNDATNLESVTVADQFVSTTSGSEDFHLASTSDAIGAGTDLGADYAIDIDGETRTGAWDIGADQFVGPGVVQKLYSSTTHIIIGFAQ